MNANEAKIRKLFLEGFTTKGAILDHVSCCPQTVQAVLTRIRDELEEECGGSLSFHVRSKAEAMVVDHLTSLSEDLGTIENELLGLEVSDKGFLPLHRHKLEVMKQIRQLSGAELVMSMRDKKALESMKDEPAEVSAPKSRVTYRPKKRTFRNEEKVGG